MPFDAEDPDAARGAQPEDADDEAPERAYRCADCGHAICRRADRCERGGMHSHVFLNPHGFVFRIGCFESAGGCAVMGEAETQHSWFPGFAWRYALCGGCSAHLGWTFESAEERFFGLVLDRLIDDESDGE
jgi:hypothetical protein